MADLTDAELDRLVERNNRYIASLRGENELKCGNGMASFALEESTTAITTLRARIAEDQAQIAALTTYRENLRDEVIELRARIAELEAFQQQAIKQVCELAREAGEAKGKLEASELPGIVDDWREKCERLERRVAELEADRAEWVEVERLREAVAASNAAIAEYYRYWTGGETRGSYDGKPERDGLWRAMYKTRAALEPKP